jgi:hypothetical protein
LRLLHFRFCSYAPSLPSQTCQLKELCSSNKGEQTVTPCFFGTPCGYYKNRPFISPKTGPPPSLQLSLSLLSTKCVSHPVSLFSLPPGPTATLHLRVVVLLFRWGVWQFYSKKADRGTTWHFSDGGRKLASCQLMKSCPLSW